MAISNRRGHSWNTACRSSDGHSPCADLATVYRRLGDEPLAEQALQDLNAFGQLPLDECTDGLIHWVDPATFASLSEGPPGGPPSVWDAFGQGEYVGNAQGTHVPEYRLRVDDVVQFVYQQVRTVSSEPYRLTAGDEIQVRSLSKPADVDSDSVIVQPDGMITLPLVGQVVAAGCTLAELREELEGQYESFFRSPMIVVTPLSIDTRLRDFLDAVRQRFGTALGGGQVQTAQILPDGTIALPGIGSMYAQGLTIPELEFEVNAHYWESLDGIAVTPALVKRAQRYVYVLGEVHSPGRFELVAPTTVSQAITLAGSWKVGANVGQVIVLRRGEDWRLMGCMVNLRDVLCFNKACPGSDVWLADSDVVILPKNGLLKANNLIEMVFTRGIYAVFPLNLNKVVE